MIADDPTPSWNLAQTIRQLFEYPFMVNAFEAGTIAAVVSACVGWFMVMRRESFAGHTLAVVGVPGASAAVVLGVSAQLGYFAFCIGAAAVMALRSGSGRDGSDGSATIGVVQAFALACGFLFASLYRGNINGINAALFGTFLGVTTDQVVALAVVGAVTLAALAVIARPLLFASVDPDVAASKGIPVRLVSAGFLILLGVSAAAASQITGGLLVFALLVLPAATAQRQTARPAVSLILAISIAVAVTWLGLATAYYSDYPIGFAITTIAFVLYLAVHARARWLHRRPVAA